MTHFASDYARCYELLYADKDYRGEAAYVTQRIRELNPRANTLLEVGCGTGKHARYLSESFAYTGCDLSADMVALAAKALPKLTFSAATHETMDFATDFDAVISLFHVVSYINDNAALERSFKNVYKHLKPGGVFLFDVWYGPAVLHQRPETRVKRVANAQIKVARLAEPEWLPNNNVVKVNYELFVENLETKQQSNFRETHAMRYFFLPEMRSMLSQAGFTVHEPSEWVSGQPCSEQTWGVCFSVQKPWG